MTEEETIEESRDKRSDGLDRTGSLTTEGHEELQESLGVSPELIAEITERVKTEGMCLHVALWPALLNRVIQSSNIFQIKKTVEPPSMAVQYLSQGISTQGFAIVHLVSVQWHQNPF
jgi:hypothetical protein